MEPKLGYMGHDDPAVINTNIVIKLVDNELNKEKKTYVNPHIFFMYGPTKCLFYYYTVVFVKAFFSKSLILRGLAKKEFSATIQAIMVNCLKLSAITNIGSHF